MPILFGGFRAMVYIGMCLLAIYIGAEQAVMAIDGLLIDPGRSAQCRGWLDGLYKLVRNDEGYTPERFVSALRELQSALDRAASS